MSDYKLYYLDGAGRIDLPDYIEASDDHDAIRQARELKRNALKCEVWQGSRTVASLDAHELSG
jgi:hypothetical protein